MVSFPVFLLFVILFIMFTLGDVFVCLLFVLLLFMFSFGIGS